MTGGFKAVGKTAAEALQLFEQIKSYEDAGAIAVELEVVPVEVATELSKRTSLLVWSMGAGAGCDAQYLFRMIFLDTQKVISLAIQKFIVTSERSMIDFS